MSVHRRRLLGQVLVVAIAASGAWQCASAQTYPSRPVRIVVPFPPGGTTDVVARIIGQRLTETMGAALRDRKPRRGRRHDRRRCGGQGRA